MDLTPAALRHENERLTERISRYYKHNRNLGKLLRRARAEASGRKAYEEDLKAALINQHVELCELTEKHTALSQTVNITYQLVERYTPYGRHVPLRNVVHWLITERSTWRTYAERDSRELRLLKDERSRAVSILMDHGIYQGDLEAGIKELLDRAGDNRVRRTWRGLKARLGSASH